MIRRPPRSTLFPTRRSSDLYCVAGGLELACWCDLRIADTTAVLGCFERRFGVDRKSTRLNSSHSQISYAVFCLKKKNPTSHIVSVENPSIPAAYAWTPVSCS